MEKIAFVWRCPYHGNLRHCGWNADQHTRKALEKLPIKESGIVGKIGTSAFIVSCDGLSREELKEFAEACLIGGCKWQV